MRGPSFSFVLGTALALAVVASAGRAEELTLAERFDATARSDGDVHREGVEALCAEGSRIAALCDERTRSPDVRERQLARALLLRVRESDRVAPWRAAFADPVARSEIVSRDPPRVRIVPRETVAKPVELGPDAAPYLDTVVRSASSPSAAPRAAIEALAVLAGADGAPTLARVLDVAGDDRSNGTPGPAAEGLRRLGAAALPVLHGLLEGDAACGSAPDWGNEALRIAAAARLVAAAGDASAVPSLRRAFARMDDWQRDAVAGALADLGADAAAPDLAQWYAATVARRIDTGEHQSFDALWRVRDALARLGPPAVDALRDAVAGRAALAALPAGAAFLQQHPDDVTAWYEIVSDRVPDPWGRRSPPFGVDDDRPDAAEGRRLWQAGLRPEGAPPAPVAMLAERALLNRDAADVRELLAIAPDMAAPIALAIASGDRRDAAELALDLAAARRPELIAFASRTLDEQRSMDSAALVEALLTLGTPEALAVVRRVVTLAAESGREDLGALRRAVPMAEAFAALDHDASRALREGDGDVAAVAARVLARRRDAAGVESLVAQSCELRGPPGPQGAFALLLRLGDTALPELDRVAGGPDGPAARVAAGVAVRVRDPALAARFDDALRAASRVEMMHVVREGDRVAAGRRLAEIGAEILPLCDVESIVQRSAIAGYAALALRGELPADAGGGPRPRRPPRTDVDQAIADVDAGKGAHNIVAGELRDALGLRGATDALLERLRAAPDDHARWRVLRLIAWFVWGYPGRDHDPEGVLVAPRREAFETLLRLLGSEDRALREQAFRKALERGVQMSDDDLRPRLAAWAAEDEAVPGGVLMWLGSHGDDDANARLVARYDAERTGDKGLAAHFGRVRYAAASASLWRVADIWIAERPGYWTRIAELDAIAAIGGEANLERLARLYRSGALLKVRLQAADCLASAGDARIREELAEEFVRIVETELARDPANRSYAPRKADYLDVHRPALALLRMAPGEGARTVYDTLLRTPAGRVREALLDAIATYRREHPEFVPPATSTD